jgi:hypothetical protein
VGRSGQLATIGSGDVSIGQPKCSWIEHSFSFDLFEELASELLLHTHLLLQGLNLFAFGYQLYTLLRKVIDGTIFFVLLCFLIEGRLMIDILQQHEYKIMLSHFLLAELDAHLQLLMHFADIAFEDLGVLVQVLHNQYSNLTEWGINTY